MGLIQRTLGLVLVPPALPLLIVFVGLITAIRRPRLGRSVAWFGLALALLSSSGIGAWRLSTWAEAGIRAQTAESLTAAMAGSDPPQAVVILGGGARAPERERPHTAIVRPLTLERLVHGAWVARTTGLPVLVAGGPPREGMDSEAAIMKRTLEESLATPVRWTEERSRSTAGNARLSAAILRKDEIGRVVLVTQAYHMPRAIASFERAGLSVLPAPHGFAGEALEWSWLSLLPTGTSVEVAYRASHELLGRLWYRLRGDQGLFTL
nr:YdcF family protein [Burkholderiaceae bacterium]